MSYYTILTTAGIAYETAAKGTGTPIKLVAMSVGDGGGAAYDPDATAKALKREVWRGPINALLQDKNNPSWLVAELSLPDDVGGFYVREVGFWTDTGVLYAIGKYPESFKPVRADGAGKEFYIRAIFETANAENVTILVDDNIVKATRTYVNDYVAAELAKLDAKQSARVATTGTISLQAVQTIDGITVVAGDRVLVKNQATASQNGIYVVASGAWSRAADADLAAEVTPGLLVYIEEGATLAKTRWQLVTKAPIVVGTTGLTFANLMDGYAPLASPTFTGDPRAPTPAPGDNDTSIATTEFVTTALANLVGAAPGALDTLAELAASLGNDANFAATVTNALAAKAPLASPTFTGDPKAPTPAASDSDTSIATTAFVRAAMAMFGLGITSVGPAMADFNDETIGSGMYYTGTSTLNPPPNTSGGQGFVLHKVYGSGAFQLYSRYGHPDFYYRSKSGTTWTNWRQVGQEALRLIGLGDVDVNVIADINDVTVGSGLYYTSSSDVNRPLGSNGVVFHKIAGASGLQLFQPAGIDRLMWRRRSASVWAPWRDLDPGTYGHGKQDYQPNWPNTSLNDCSNVGSGVYRTIATTTDYPAGVNTVCVVQFYIRAADAPNSVFQAVQIVTHGDAGRQFIRRASTGTAAAPAWGAWRELAYTDSPALTGAPTAPTAATGTSTTQLATTAFVQAAISGLVGAAPGALDTLNELATAIGNDANFAATMTGALAGKAPLASPTLTGDPKAPTAAFGDNDTSIATTAFVQAATRAFGLGTTTMLPTVGNLNDPNIRNGWYIYNGGAGSGNGPTTFGVVLVCSQGVDAGAWANQIFFSTDGKPFYRYNVNSATVWSAWQQLWTSASFDPASKSGKEGNAAAIGASGILPYIRAADNSVIWLQTALNYVPIRQGGGTYQLNNTVYLGWDGIGLRAQVDGSDLGRFWTEANEVPKLTQTLVGLGTGAVGTYALLYSTNSSTVAAGGLVSGANLIWSDTAENNGGVVGYGTWRAMGAAVRTNATLYRRDS